MEGVDGVRELLVRALRGPDEALRAAVEDAVVRLGGAPVPEEAAAAAVAAVARSFPIRDYEDLTAAEVIERLDGLDALDLRRIADHERRGANRKSVLSAIDRLLR